MIPMPGSVDHGGGVRSLNLATAAGVVLFEALRQLGETGLDAGVAASTSGLDPTV
jgi:tRNA (cytidine/uridine-2'-O-)-methyltransferase